MVSNESTNNTSERQDPVRRKHRGMPPRTYGALDALRDGRNVVLMRVGPDGTIETITTHANRYIHT